VSNSDTPDRVCSSIVCIIVTSQHVVLIGITACGQSEPMIRQRQGRPSLDLARRPTRKPFRPLELKEERQPGRLELHVIPPAGLSFFNERGEDRRRH